MYYLASKEDMLKYDQLSICKCKEKDNIKLEIIKWNDGFQTNLKVIEFCPLNDNGEPCKL